MLVPGLAFSRSGARLGRGKGFYDNYLIKYHQKFGKFPRTVALAFNEQVLPEVPVTENDVTIDLVLYENSDLK